MTTWSELDEESRALLEKLKAFALPGGEDAARRIFRVRFTEEGEMRSSPEARWIPFTAEETIDARHRAFVWEARFRAGGILPMHVTDAYEEGHGRLVVRVGGRLPVVNGRGPHFDKGEIQRYLSYLDIFPSILVLHPTLAWGAAGAGMLRVADTADLTGATVDIRIGDVGSPLGCRTDRPRTVGEKVIETPWFGNAGDFHEWEGLRLPKSMEAGWHLPEGPYTYFRGRITSIAAEC